jgi:hypothetical protein
MRILTIVLPVVSYFICKGIVHIVLYLDTSFMQSHPIITSVLSVALLTIIPVIVLLNVLYHIHDERINYNASNSSNGSSPTSPSWMEFQNYENLNSIRKSLERSDVDFK